jgi:M6 family metalloprotease-like protein
MYWHLLLAGAALVAVTTPLATPGAVSGQESVRAVCTQAEKTKRVRALDAYRKEMRVARKRYFTTHKDPAARKRFVERQQARLRVLQRAAACTVPAPKPPPEPPQPEPPLPAQEGAPCSPALAPNAQQSAMEAQLGNAWLNEGPITSRAVLPATGSVNAVVIPVDFADAPATEDATAAGMQVTSQLGWFEAVSGGKLRVAATVLRRWYRIGRPASSYGQWHMRGAGQELLMDAMAAADADVDFSDKRFVFVLVPSSFPQSGNPAWVVLPGLGVTRDGVEIHNATFLKERGPFVANHELTHSLGIPDMYFYNEAAGTADFTLVGQWDPMSTPNGRHLLAWHKWQLRWIDPAQIACLNAPGTLTAHLSPNADPAGVKLVLVPLTPSIAYAIEARAPGREPGMCKPGVLVYTVDSQPRNGQGPVRVMRHQADMPGPGCDLLYNAPFPVGSTYEDASVRVEVLAPLRSGVWSLRVTRK